MRIKTQNRQTSQVTWRQLALLVPRHTARFLASLACAVAPVLTACVNTTTRQPVHSASPLQEPPEKSAIVIHGYKKDLVGIRAVNPDVRLRVDHDPTLKEEPVLFVENPSPTNDPAARDVHLDTENRDWKAARAIGFRIKPEHAMRFSVSFVARNRVAYTAWTQLRGGVWQSVRIAFHDIRSNPYFQPPGAKTGAPIDVGEVNSIAFAPQDPASGRFVISQFVLLN